MLLLPKHIDYKVEKHKRSIWYYVPELDKWVSKIKIVKVLEQLGYTLQQYYDKYLLKAIQDKYCCICGKELEFHRSYGYNKVCSIKCQGKYHSINVDRQKLSNSVKLSHNSPELKAKLSASAKARCTDEWREQNRQRQLIVQNKPEVREKAAKTKAKTLLNPEVHIRMSNGQRRRRDNCTVIHTKQNFNHEWLHNLKYCLTKSTIYVRSSYEKSFIAILEQLHIYYEYESLVLTYKLPTEFHLEPRRYVVDFVVHLTNNKKLLIKVKNEYYMQSFDTKYKAKVANVFIKRNTDYVDYVIIGRHYCFNIDNVKELLKTYESCQQIH